MVDGGVAAGGLDLLQEYCARALGDQRNGVRVSGADYRGLAKRISPAFEVIGIHPGRVERYRSAARDRSSGQAGAGSYAGHGAAAAATTGAAASPSPAAVRDRDLPAGACLRKLVGTRQRQ